VQSIHALRKQCLSFSFFVRFRSFRYGFVVVQILAAVIRSKRRMIRGSVGAMTMTQAVTLYLPEDTLQRYRRGEAVAGKGLDEFIADRLAELGPPLADDLPDSLRDELKSLEEADDQTLWQAARCCLSAEKQEQYDRVLVKHAEGSLTTDERRRLHELGDEARRLTLKKAHALMLLKWRGHGVRESVPLRSRVQRVQGGPSGIARPHDRASGAFVPPAAAALE